MRSLSNASVAVLSFKSTGHRSQDFVDGGLWQVPSIAALYYGTDWLLQNDTITSMVKTNQQQIQNSN